MKKFEKILTLLLTIIGVTLFSACSEDKDEPEMPKPKTTYTITIESTADQLAQKNGLISKIDLSLIEYNDINEVVNIQDWFDIKDGTSTQKFTANEHATKLIIQYHVYAYKNGKEVVNENLYYAIVYYLNLNSNLQIILDGNSRISKYNPI